MDIDGLFKGRVVTLAANAPQQRQFDKCDLFPDDVKMAYPVNLLIPEPGVVLNWPTGFVCKSIQSIIMAI